MPSSGRSSRKPTQAAFIKRRAGRKLTVRQFNTPGIQKIGVEIGRAGALPGSVIRIGRHDDDRRVGRGGREDEDCHRHGGEGQYGSGSVSCSNDFLLLN